MALTPVQINKGQYSNVSKEELTSGQFAAVHKNLMLTDSGANVDRPALKSFANLSSFGVDGLYYFELADKLIAVTKNDRKVWSIAQNGSATDITGSSPLEGSARPVFAEDGTYLAIAGGGEPKQWSGTGSTEALAGSPPDTKFISYLDGYWILHLIDDQEFRYAGPTEAARQSFSSANFFQAEGLPDKAIAQAVLLRELWAFGNKSCEIFQNFGDSSVPFRRSFFIDRGIGAPNSLVQDDNTLFWLDSDRRFVQAQGKTPLVISKALDRDLARMSTVSDCWGARIFIDGFQLIMWGFPTEQRTFVYHLDQKEWYEWDSFVNGESDKFRANCHVYVPNWKKHFVGDPVVGNVYELSRSAKTDGAFPLRRLRQTGVYNHGTNNRKKSNYYLIDIERGVGTPGQTEPVFQMRVNDDNQGWTDYVDIPLGFSGSDKEPIRVSELGGIYRKRQLEIKMTDPSEFSLRSIEEDVEAMSS